MLFEQGNRCSHKWTHSTQRHAFGDFWKQAMELLMCVLKSRALGWSSSLLSRPERRQRFCYGLFKSLTYISRIPFDRSAFFHSFRCNKIESLEIVFQLALQFALNCINIVTKAFASFFDNFKNVLRENKSRNSFPADGPTLLRNSRNISKQGSVSFVESFDDLSNYFPRNSRPFCQTVLDCLG